MPKARKRLRIFSAGIVIPLLAATFDLERACDDNANSTISTDDIAQVISPCRERDQALRTELRVNRFDFWKSSKLGESMDDFRRRAIKEEDDTTGDEGSEVFPWVLHEMPHWGIIRDAKRNGGTVQKDWAVADPDSAASYAMAISFEIVGQEISIYEPLLVAVHELQAQVEMETEAEVEREEDDEADE